MTKWNQLFSRFHPLHCFPCGDLESEVTFTGKYFRVQCPSCKRLVAHEDVDEFVKEWDKPFREAS